MLTILHGLQEEIAHCAAGVRWLTYLHTQALTANHGQEHDVKQQLRNVTLAEPCSSSDSSSVSSSRPMQPADLALDVQHKNKACHPCERNVNQTCSTAAANGMSVTESTQAAATVMQTSCDSHAAHAASEPEAKGSYSQAAKGTSGKMALHAWQADAVKYATVEEWFHSLVRAHFKGSLKVSLHLTSPTLGYVYKVLRTCGCSLKYHKRVNTIRCCQPSGPVLQADCLMEP